MNARPRNAPAAAGVRGRWLLFVRRYGWRAYALPILMVITVAAIVRGTPSTASAQITPLAGRKSAATAETAVSSPPASQSSSAATSGKAKLQVEGLTAGDAGFGAASTPSPIVINLGDETTSCATNSYPQLVLVSLSKQHLWACQGAKQVNSTAVTTGKSVDNDQTPLGSWRVQAKQRDRYLVGAGYRDYVKYWMPFDGDFGLHDASWQTMPFGSKDYVRDGSHGCVHLPTATMAWLYNWAAVGQTVVSVVS